MNDQYTDIAHCETSTAVSNHHLQTKAGSAQLKHAFMRIAAMLVIVLRGLA
jgi:hypothetical protein